MVASAAAVDAPRLLFTVPEDADASVLRMEISVDGRLFVDDVLELRDGARSGTFELLTRDTERAARLTALAGAEKCPAAQYGVVEVRPSALIFADGRWQGEFDR